MADNRLSDLVGQLWAGDVSRREFMQRAAAAGIGASAVTAALTQGANAAPATRTTRRSGRYAADQRTLVIADVLNGQDWLNLDPGQFYEINAQAGINMVYETLYHIPDGSKPTDIQPLLADGMPTFSEDGLTVTIKLKSGVKFHTSGNEMTADDVVFSSNRLKNGGAQSAFLGSDYWTEIKAVDATTVEYTLASPNAALAAVLTSVMLAVTDSARVKEMGGTDAAPTGDDPATSPEVLANQAARDLISSDSVGTGPYMVEQFDRDSEIIIAANTAYWGDAPQLDRIIWRNTNEANAQVQLVQTDEADMSYAMPIEMVDTIKADTNLQIISGATLALQYMAMNMVEEKGGPVSNVQVRQAIAHAIDYDGIIAGVMGGAAVRPAAPIPLPLTGSEAVEDQKYVLDLAKAQELWDGSGVGDQEITLTYDSDSPAQGGASLETLAVKIQSDLQQIKGLTITLAPAPGAERIAAYRAGDFQMTLSPWTPDYPDVDSYAGPFGRTDTAAAKRVGFSNPEVDALLDQGLAETDPAKREEIYVRIQQIMIENAAFVVIYQPIDQKPARTTVQGVTVHPVNQIQLRFASKTA